MDPAAWLQKALDELVELGPVAENAPADAWRAGVLIARLLGSPSGPVPPAALVRRLPETLAVAGLPDPQQILDRIADQLDSETDPWGPLLDALLDADDTLGVLATSGQSETALGLARRVAGLASVYAERVIPLGPFAEMRLQTIREGATAGLLWSAVERSPAHAVVEALPAQASSKTRVERFPASRPEPAHARVLSFRVPEELQLAAAESETAEARELETEGAGRAWMYAEKGRMRLEVRGVGGGPLSTTLIAERLKDGAVERFPASRPEPACARVLSFRVPEELQLAAAESETAEARKLEREGAGRAWVYAEKGRMRLEVRGVGAGPLSTTLIAERLKDGAEVSRVAVDVEVSGGTAYADLGPRAGPENALHRLVAGTGLASSDVRVRLTVSNG